MSTRLIKYSGEIGRKPTSPAFLYDFHNDTAGGTTVIDRFGNGGDLTIGGTLGTAWTANRGWITPSVLNTPMAGAYGLDAMPVLEPGRAFCVGFRWMWPSAKPTQTEIVCCLGRATVSYGFFGFGLNGSGILHSQTRGLGASTVNGITFGSSSLYVAGQEYSGLLHVEVTDTGLIVNGYLDGVQVGSEYNHLWSANGGSVPSASHFSDGTVFLARRVGVSTFDQPFGGTSGGATKLSTVLVVSMDGPDLNFAQALALEQKNFPRYVGKVLGAA